MTRAADDDQPGRARDDRRTAALLLAAGPRPADPAALERLRQDRRVRVRPVPGLVRRIGEDAARRLGALDHERAVLAPLAAARRRAHDGAPSDAPRFLVRVDEFPHYRAWERPREFGTGAYARFHEIMRRAGVPYLVAVLPRLSARPLDPEDTRERALSAEEIELLARLPAEQVSFALHGRTHRTRFASPRRHSELVGRSTAQTESLLDDALAELARAGADRPQVFVPPFNRFSAAQWPVLERRFDVIAGGPESVRQLGFHRSPQWRGDAVYLPAYAPFYGRAGEIRPAVERALARPSGLWIPIVLHWGWEAEAGFEELRRLADVIAAHAVPWTAFLDEVAASR